MFYTNILTNFERINNTVEKIFKILSASMKQIYCDEGLTVNEHRYKINCGRIDIEVVCPKIIDQGNANDQSYLIIPEFLIPGRPYPIYVYLYAIITYCLNLKMGQREAAKRTRERFGLKTFSYTTIGRAVINLEEQIKKHERGSYSEDETNESADEGGKKFPTVEQVKARKEKVASYLMKAAAGDSTLIKETIQQSKQPDYRKPPYIGTFIDACHTIVRYIFLKYHCLLL